MVKKIFNFFDKMEDRVRGHLSRYPIIYTFIGGIALVLFWRGVWHTADILQAQGGILGFIFYEPVNAVIVLIILLATGLFISNLIGDSILLSGLTKQKKLNEKTSREVKEEEDRLLDISTTIREIKREVDEIKEVVENSKDENKKE